MDAKRSRVEILKTLLIMAMAACDTGITSPQVGPGPIDIDVDPQDQKAAAPFSFEVPVTGQTSVRLKGVSGTVHFIGTDGQAKVEVGGERRVGSETQDDAQARLALLQVGFAESPNEILIETYQPQYDGRNYEVDYTIRLPRSMKVNVKSTNGGVTLEGLEGGAIVELVNGKIQADLTLPPSGLVDLFTVNGEIDLKVQREASAQFKATLMRGNITTVNLHLQDQVTTPRSVAGRLGDGTGLITLELVNGDIRAQGR